MPDLNIKQSAFRRGVESFPIRKNFRELKYFDLTIFLRAFLRVSFEDKEMVA